MYAIGWKVADTVHRKIANGTLANITDHPFRVAILAQYRDFSDWVWKFQDSCSGNTLNEWWVLTAAHCVVDLYRKNGTLCKSMRIYLAVGTVNIPAGVRSQDVLDSEYARKHMRYPYFSLVHPKYHADVFPRNSHDVYEMLQNDIALIKLDEPIRMDGVTTKAVTLPRDGEDIHVGQEYTVAGWGFIENDDETTNLMETKVRVVEPVTCFRFPFPTIAYLNFLGSKICTRTPQTGARPGDSGAGLVGHRVTKDNGVEPVIFGVHSMGAWMKRNFTEYYEGLGTRVSFYVDWIKEMMNKWTTKPLQEPKLR